MSKRALTRTVGGTACLLAAAGASAQIMTPTMVLDPVAAMNNAGYGTSVALTSTVAAIGSVSDNRVYIYPRTMNGVGEPIVLTDPFGRSKGLGSAIAMQGSTLVAGAPLIDVCGPAGGPTSSGVLMVYELRAERTSAQQLTHSGQDRIDQFGCSVAIDGDTIIAGAKYDNSSGHSAGTAWTFRRVNGVWALEAQLVGNDARMGDLAGWSVDIKGDVAVVGAPMDSSTINQAGSARIFERGPGGWMHVASLEAPTPTELGAFGVAVATDGTRVVVGETRRNRAHVFVRGSNGWRLEQTIAGARWGGEFGARIEIEGDRLFVGAPQQNTVETFSLNAGRWTRTDRLTSSLATPGSQFGIAMALHGRDLLVGARYAGPDGLAVMHRERLGTSSPNGSATTPADAGSISR